MERFASSMSTDPPLQADRDAIARWENEGCLVRAADANGTAAIHTKFNTMRLRRPTMATGRTFKTRIDLPLDRREKLIALLNQQLADSLDLYSQSKQAHWNVKGPQFHQLHELFDQLAGVVLGHVDLIAERATALGGTALGTVRMSAGSSRLPDFPLDPGGSMSYVDALAERFANLAATTRAAIDASDKLGDADTADLFTEVSRDLDKSLWFLEAHVQA